MKTFKEFLEEGWNRRSQRKSKRDGLTPTSEKDGRPKGYVVVGLPGSGKSSLVKHMKSKESNVTQHELDKSRQELGKSPKYFGPDLMAHHQAGIKDAAKKGKTIVVSNTSIPKQHRQAALDNLSSQGYNAKSVLPPTSRKAAQRRNRNRTGTEPGSSQVPKFVMNSMARQMKGINTRPRSGGALSRKDAREARRNYKELHKKYRFTKPAMRRSGAIKE